MILCKRFRPEHECDDEDRQQTGNPHLGASFTNLRNAIGKIVWERYARATDVRQRSTGNRF
jgi:hypothetical protein